MLEFNCRVGLKSIRSGAAYLRRLLGLGLSRICESNQTLSEKGKHYKTKKLLKNQKLFVCPGKESNLHARKCTAPSRLRVYQFHHQGIYFSVTDLQRFRVLCTERMQI